MQRFQFLKLAAAAVIAVPLLLSGCGDKKSTELKVGATAGPHAANVQKAGLTHIIFNETSLTH